MDNDANAQFPDLTLPEKNARSPGDTTSPDSGHAPQSTATPSNEITVQQQFSWKTGAWVLAPRDPTFLHIAVVNRVEDERVFVDFLDGESEWVRPERLRTLQLERGQKLHCRQQISSNLWYVDATIIEVGQDAVRVLTAGGGPATWIALAGLAVAVQSLKPFDVAATRFATESFVAGLKPGDEVWAPWESFVLYPATVDKVQSGEAHVVYDADYAAWVKPQQLLPLEIPVGLKAFARWRMQAAYHPCAVQAVDEKDVLVRYLDGSEEWLPLKALAITRAPYGPPAWVSKTPESAGDFTYLLCALFFLMLLFVPIACL